MICSKWLLLSQKYQLVWIPSLYYVSFSRLDSVRRVLNASLNVRRKGEKIDICSDKRDQETMEDWDQETPEKVIESKKTEYNQNKPTEIYKSSSMVGSGFVQIVAKTAPPGYIIKSQMKALLEEKSDRLPIEDEIEDQWKKRSRFGCTTSR